MATILDSSVVSDTVSHMKISTRSLVREFPKAKAAAQAAGSDNDRIVAEANAKAAGIIDEARKSAETVRTDLIARAEADAADIRARANADAEMATERAMAELQSQVATLSVDLAERVVQRNLDRDTQQALVESFINEVGRS